MTKRKTRTDNNRYLRTNASGGHAKTGRGRSFGLGFSFIVIVLVMVFLYFGRQAQLEIENEATALSTTLTLPGRIELGETLTLPTAAGDFTLVWSSSNEDVITRDGLVTHPSHAEGEATVVMTATPVVIETSLFLMVFKPTLSSASFTIVVACALATPAETARMIFAGITLPTVTASSLSLPLSFPGTELAVSWSTSDATVMTQEGTKNANGPVVLTLTLSGGNYAGIKEYQVTCVESLSVTEIAFSFDGETGGTYGVDWQGTGYAVHQGIIHDETADQTEESLDTASRGCLYLKTTTTDGIMSMASLTATTTVLDPCLLSFHYAVLDSHTTYTKDAHLVIMNGTDELATIPFATSADEEGIFTLDLTALARMDLVIRLSAEYASLRLALDDITITRELHEEDVTASLASALPARVSSDMILPTTSNYGGSLALSLSPSGPIAANGTVTLAESEQVVTVTMTLSGVFASPVVVKTTITVTASGLGTSLTITFIDLGKYGMSDCGEATVISYGDMDILVDAGDNIAESKRAVTEALQSLVTDGTIENVIATHPDSDHIGGMASVYGNYQVANTILFNGTATSKNYLAFKAAYESEPDSTYVTIGDVLAGKNGLKATLTLAPGITITFLDTGYLDDATANGRSLVFRLDALGTSVLFTGDADDNGRQLEEHYMNDVGNIDILKVVHHGTANGTTSAFLTAVDPECAIICNGNYLGNKYGHPSYQAVNRLYQHDALMNVYAIAGGDSDECALSSSGSYICSPSDRFVDRNGTITITVTGKGYAVASEYGLKEFSQTAFWKSNPKRSYQHA